MKPTQEQVIAWAREAGIEGHRVYGGLVVHHSNGGWINIQALLECITALAYEAGRESTKWDGIHTCHDQCQRPACVARRDAYKAGYEAGRKDENEAAIEDARTVGGEASAEMEKLIRARRGQ